MTPLSLPARSIVRHFFREYVREKWFYVYTLSSFLGNTAYVLDTYFVAKMVDALRIYYQGNASAEPVLLYFYCLIATGILTWIFNRIQDIGTAKSQITVAKRVQERIFTHLHHQSHGYFTNNFAGSLFKKMSRYVRTFEDMTDLTVYRIIGLFVHIVTTCAFVFYFSWQAGIVVVVYICLYAFLSLRFERWRHPFIDAHDRTDSQFSGYLTDTISNHTTVQAFGNFSQELITFRRRCDEAFQALYTVWRKSNIMSATLGIVAFGSYWILTGIGLYLALHGQIVFATFLIINTYNGTLTDKAWGLGDVFKTFGKIIADAREGLEILHTPHEITDAPDAETFLSPRGEISFQSVTFGYGQNTIFKDLTLTIPARQKVGIVGVSGSGKSTLTKLLMRLYDIQSGSISLDGHDITAMTQESLHKNIALVPQDPTLFHRSLRDNITYARPDITTADFQKYCHIARCDIFIEQLPANYDTTVGERGLKLSGGERQRVAIARALIAETPIIVFDEATSALDSESEQYIQAAMFDAIEGKTALVIAHRLSTIVHMDRILVFDHGCIIEDGTHEELMRLGGAYARLWTIQSGEFRK